MLRVCCGAKEPLPEHTKRPSGSGGAAGSARRGYATRRSFCLAAADRQGYGAGALACQGERERHQANFRKPLALLFLGAALGYVFSEVNAK
jgi:hypothetical protein